MISPPAWHITSDAEAMWSAMLGRKSKHLEKDESRHAISNTPVGLYILWSLLMIAVGNHKMGHSAALMAEAAPAPDCTHTPSVENGSNITS